MTRLHTLLFRWDDGTLTTDEQAELLMLLESPTARRELVRHWTFNRAVRDALSLAQPGPLAGDRRAEGRQEESPSRHSFFLPPPSVLRPLLALAAAVLLLVCGWLLWPTSPSLARIVEVAGVVEVIDAQGRVSVGRAGQRLYAGQSVRASDDEGFAAIEYPDATRLELHAGARVRLDASRVQCQEGVVRAEVGGAALLLETPQGDVRAQDGHVLVSATAGSVRVDLETGTAEMLRPGAQAIEMGGGSYTVATAGPEAPVVRPLPRLLTRPLRQIDARVARALRYGPGGRLEAANPRGVKIVPPKGEAELHPLPGRKGESRLALGGGLLAVGGPQQITVYDLSPFAGRDPIVGRGMQALTLAADGSWLAWAERRGLIHIHGPDGRAKRPPVRAGGKGPFVLASASDSGSLAVAGPGWARVLRLTPKGERELTGLDGGPRLLACGEGGRVAAATADGTVFVWGAEEPGPLHVIRQHARPVTAVSFSPDGRTLAAGCADGQVWLFDTTTGEAAAVIRAGRRAVLAVAFHPDGTRLAAALQAGPLTEWAVPSR